VLALVVQVKAVVEVEAKTGLAAAEMAQVAADEVMTAMVEAVNAAMEVAVMAVPWADAVVEAARASTLHQGRASC